MFDVFLGCIAFGLLYIFDFNKVKKIHPFFTSFFALGVAMLAWSTLRLIVNESSVIFPPTTVTYSIFFALSFLSAGFMFYALFGALPFQKTYIKGTNNQVVDTGVYALCRHPGVWGFFFAYLFLFLATGKWMILVATVVWTLMDVAHVWAQDVYFFPNTLVGYTQYQQTTPFLLITPESFTRFRQTVGK